MTGLEEIKNTLNSLCEDGEFSIEDENIYWYVEDSSEDQDLLWVMYCEASAVVTGQGYDLEDNWQDNDSAGFKVVINEK